MSTTTQSLQLPVILPSGPECERCVARLRSALEHIKGVAGASVDSTTATIHVAFDPNVATLSRIEQEARRIGAEMASQIDHKTIDMRDLDCPDCASSIEKAVTRLPGVLWAGANFASAQIHVEYDRKTVTLNQICRAVEGHGVRACPVGPAAAGKEDAASTTPSPIDWLRNNRRLVNFGLVTVLMAMAWPLPHNVQATLLLAATVLGGWHTAFGGWRAVRARALDMNVLMTLAVIGAAAIGDLWEAASVVGLFNLGNLLQAGAMERTRASIRNLMSLGPNVARVRRGSAVVEEPANKLSIGDLVLVNPGERIPADGEIIYGRSAINEAPITGESMPRDKGPGDAVYAGTLNGTGALEIRATAAASDTTLARILHRVEEAQAQRAPAQQMIDLFASKYTPIVVSLAATVAVIPPVVQIVAGHPAAWFAWFLKALALLIIACPCALVISTPVAIVTAIGSASRRGVLIKGGAFLEEVGRLRALLYDKTGTLTQGKFQVSEVVALGALNESEVIAIAAAIESRSEHPLAQAFDDENHHRNGHHHLEPQSFEAVSGMGAKAMVEGRAYIIGNTRMMAAESVSISAIETQLSNLEESGKTVVILASGSEPLALFALADTPRTETKETVQQLGDLGIAHQAMLTGDQERSAAAVAQTVGLKEWSAGLLPDQKLQIVRDTQARYGSVGMIGDGINDAPALAASSVGIVMGAAGSDTAMEVADIALMGDSLSRLPFLIRLSRRSAAIIRQNIAFSLATKLGLIAMALTVGLPLWLAVMGDVGVSLLVTLNALRLRS